MKCCKTSRFTGLVDFGSDKNKHRHINQRYVSKNLCVPLQSSSRLLRHSSTNKMKTFLFNVKAGL